MALNPEQQALELITRASNILVITREHPTVDIVSSAVAFYAFAKAMKAPPVTLVVPGFDAASAPAFMPCKDAIRPAMGPLRALEISLDVSKTPIDEFLYDVRDGVLAITVIPKEREWNVNDLTFRHGRDRYDLIVAIGASDMNALGAAARDHADFFHRTTVINIDHSPANERWGQVNLVDLNAVSTTEILFERFSTWNRPLIDDHIATALLAGMISETRSFRTPNVTPRTLASSGELVTMGAKREIIVNDLWRTRSVETLKLWGHALSRLRHEPEEGIVWTVISHKDFLETGADANAADGMIDELVSSAPEAKIAVLISEHENGNIRVTLSAALPRDARELGRAIGALGTRDRVTVTLTNIPLLEAVKNTINLLKKTAHA